MNNNTNSNTFHFQRFEFKYILPREKVSHIIEDCLKNNLKWDPFVEKKEGKQYPVLSLYFDTPSWKCYYEKNAGNRDRFKVRLRSYSRDFRDGNLFFEIKRKSDAVIMKDRISFPAAEYAGVIQDVAGLLYRDSVRGSEHTTRELIAKTKRFLLAPKLFVLYERMPLVGNFIDGFRVTFDSSISAAKFDSSGKLNFLPVLQSNVVMEVKYHNTLPAWFQKIIQAHNLERSAFSKYGKSVEALSRFHQI